MTKVVFSVLAPSCEAFEIRVREGEFPGPGGWVVEVARPNARWAESFPTIVDRIHENNDPDPFGAALKSARNYADAILDGQDVS